MRELAVCAPCLCLTLKFQKSQGANADSENHCCELGLVAIALANQKRNQASQSNLSAEFLSDSEEPLCLEHIAMFSYFFNRLLGLSLNWETRNLVECGASRPIINVKEPCNRHWRLHLSSRVALVHVNVENAFQNSEASIRSSVYERPPAVQQLVKARA